MNPLHFACAMGLLPLKRALAWLTWRGSSYRLWCAGRCCFYGNPEFLALCRSAMECISLMDPVLHAFLEQEKLRFWFEPSGQAIFPRYFGISNEYIAWRESGVIACICYTHFAANLGHDRGPWWRLTTKPAVVRRNLHLAVRAWLEQHGFPCELVACFDV